VKGPPVQIPGDETVCHPGIIQLAGEAFSLLVEERHASVGQHGDEVAPRGGQGCGRPSGPPTISPTASPLAALVSQVLSEGAVDSCTEPVEPLVLMTLGGTPARFAVVHPWPAGAGAPVYGPTAFRACDVHAGLPSASNNSMCYYLLNSCHADNRLVGLSALSPSVATRTP